MFASWFGDWDIFAGVFAAMKKFACWLIKWLFEIFYAGAELLLDSIPEELMQEFPTAWLNEALECGVIFYPVAKVSSIFMAYFVFWCFVTGLRIVIKLIPWIG